MADDVAQAKLKEAKRLNKRRQDDIRRNLEQEYWHPWRDRDHMIGEGLSQLMDHILKQDAHIAKLEAKLKQK